MIARDLSQCAGFGPSAVTIGIFDGVHAGHRELLHSTVSCARQRSLHAVAMTFDPHPTAVVAPSRVPRLLMSLDRRCQAILAEGIDHVLVLQFTPEVARLTPEEFVVQYLCSGLGAHAVLVGENFTFGHARSGNIETLHSLGHRFGFTTEFLNPVERRGRVASSTEIRRAIQAGEVALAARLLERAYALEGDVVHGHGIGAKQTVPTLNLQTSAEVLPALGVYITQTVDLDRNRSWNSITNVGRRPTFGGDSLSIETYLLGSLEAPTPTRIRVEFLRRVRDERKFESPETLKAQIFRDVARAQAFFRRWNRWVAAVRH